MSVKDLTGKKFGRLTVLYENGRTPKGLAIWHCKCDCDNECDVRGVNLTHGTTKSCGCYSKDIIRQVGYNNRKSNRYDLSGEYGIGYTSKGEEFYFDLEDYELIKDYCWVISRTTGDVVARVRGQNKNITMHRLVMSSPKEMEIDHIFHKRYDNRKSQLRVCTTQQNGLNVRTQRNNTSGVKGVSWDNKDKLWHAYIEINGKRTNKYFKKDEFDKAVAWRKEKEVELFGEFRCDE